jgi:hypothetical protein
MIKEGKCDRIARGVRSDKIGKVFFVVGQDVRRCLVCEQVFTRRAASEHATVPCIPGTNMNLWRK